MKLGSFTQDEEGTISGRVTGLGIGSVPVRFQPEVSRKGEPFFRLVADPDGEAFEIGAAFPKEKNGAPYHSVTMDSPLFAAPVSAALFYDQSTGFFNLVWDRVASQAPKAEVHQAAKTGQKAAHPHP